MTWRKILNDKYEASNDGRIRNARTKREVKQFVGKDGYLRTQVAGKTRLVHRLIGSAFPLYNTDGTVSTVKVEEKQ